MGGGAEEKTGAMETVEGMPEEGDEGAKGGCALPSLRPLFLTFARGWPKKEGKREGGIAKKRKEELP